MNRRVQYDHCGPPDVQEESGRAVNAFCLDYGKS